MCYSEASAPSVYRIQQKCPYVSPLHTSSLTLCTVVDKSELVPTRSGHMLSEEDFGGPYHITNCIFNKRSYQCRNLTILGYNFRRQWNFLLESLHQCACYAWELHPKLHNR